MSTRTDTAGQNKHIKAVPAFTLSESVHLTHGPVFVLTDTIAQMQVRHYVRKAFLLKASYTTLRMLSLAGI